MTRFFIIFACIVVVLAGLKAASSLVVPFLLATFLAVLLSPPFVTLRGHGLHSGLALFAMIAGLAVLGFLTVTVLRSSLDQFIDSLPTYEANLRVQLENFWQLLAEFGIEVPRELIADNLNPQLAMNYAGRLARALSGMIGQVFIIFLVVAFMLMEAAQFERKLHAIPNIQPDTIAALDQNFQDVRRYVSIKSVMSLLTGILVGVGLWALGVDNALFMGVLAFFLNFVPTIGSIIAAIPGVILAFIQFGPSVAMYTAGLYLAINVGIGNVLEPRFMGDGLGLSALVVVLSMIFWGWLLGPVGMLLSVPLTLVLKFALEIDPKSQPVAAFLGPAPKKDKDVA